MKIKILSICKSKANILSVSLSIFLFLKDINEVITGIASHAILIGLSIAILISLLIINLSSTKSEADIVDDNLSEDVEKSKHKKNIALLKKQQDTKTTFFTKIIFATLLFFTLMTIGSLYYIKNLGVYYVVLQNDLSFNQAKILKDETNCTDEFIEQGLSTRFIADPRKKGKYELILFNGYINESKAETDLKKLRSIKTNFHPYRTEKPQFVPNFFRKLWYIQNDIFH
jgi:hypothetical protein